MSQDSGGGAPTAVTLGDLQSDAHRARLLTLALTGLGAGQVAEMLGGYPQHETRELEDALVLHALRLQNGEAKAAAAADVLEDALGPPRIRTLADAVRDAAEQVAEAIAAEPAPPECPEHGIQPDVRIGPPGRKGFYCSLCLRAALSRLGLHPLAEEEG